MKNPFPRCPSCASTHAPSPGQSETPRVADSSAASACRVFHNSIPPSKQNRLANPPPNNVQRQSTHAC